MKMFYYVVVVVVVCCILFNVKFFMPTLDNINTLPHWGIIHTRQLYRYTVN